MDILGLLSKNPGRLLEAGRLRRDNAELAGVGGPFRIRIPRLGSPSGGQIVSLHEGLRATAGGPGKAAVSCAPNMALLSHCLLVISWSWHEWQSAALQGREIWIWCELRRARLPLS